MASLVAVKEAPPGDAAFFLLPTDSDFETHIFRVHLDVQSLPKNAFKKGVLQ